MPIRIASWVADGIAYLATEKSVTDHGLSLVAQQDCALWRGVMGEQICRSEDGIAIAVAAGDTPVAPAPRRERVPATMVGPGLYYVIGSFSQWNNAERLAARHGTLAPSIVTGKLDGRRLFRVVIGPFGPSEQEDLRALIHRVGHYDAWAARMNSAEWSVARSTGTARNQEHSIAQLTKPFGV